MIPEKLPAGCVGLVGGVRSDGGYLCPMRWYRSHGGFGHTNCGCKRFSDHSCVHPMLVDEHSARRDEWHSGDRTGPQDFDHHSNYAAWQEHLSRIGWEPKKMRGETNRQDEKDKWK